MKIYRLAWPDGYEFLNTVGWDDQQALRAFGTGARRRLPVEVRLERSYEEHGRDHLRPSDFPWLAGNAPAYSRRAVAALRSILELHGEIVPLRGADDAFAALDVRIRLNALDREALKAQRFRSGRIMTIETYAFHREAVGDWAIFTDRDWDEVFVAQEYVDAVAATGLEGAGFDLIADLD